MFSKEYPAKDGLAISMKILAVGDVAGILNQTKSKSERKLKKSATQPSEDTTMTQPAKLLYTAKAHTIGGRQGCASRTSDGRLEVKLSLPGGPGNGTNCYPIAH